MAPARLSSRRSHEMKQAAIETAAAAAGSDPSDKLVWLHGDLDIWIHEAQKLPNMDMASEHLRRCFTACRPPFSAVAAAARCGRGGGHNPSHRGRSKIITSDPYVNVSLAGAVIARTRVITNAQNPIYEEHFIIPVAHRVNRVEFHIKDDDFLGAQHIGTATIPAARLVAGEEISGEWLQVLGSNGKPPKPDTALRVSMRFTPIDQDDVNVHGIAGNPEKTGVPQTYFPLRKGGMVTLYQDAHIKEGDLPKINLDDDNVYVPARCWEDICHAILDAHHLVYIVGWSIFTKVKLVREPTRELPPGHDLTLGDLLKYKTQEGVRVCMLVWDDKTSHDKFLIKTGGVMQTHDEETRKFFKHSSVICVLSPRYASSKLSYIRQQVVGTLYTHHQKCVIVDTQAYGNNRKIMAFIGGLDLCDGRYDTPQHRLFSDLETIYKDDFHNPTFAAASKGPRQPWHDLHCKIEGPAAYDVLTNFEQRWKKATKWQRFGRRFKKASRWRDDALIKLERISWILSPSATLPPDDHRLWVTREEDPQTWHVQVFRSIDSGSVKGFPKDVHEAEKLNLACGKNLVVDKSIHTAYVKAIRSARHFIYIENQYFLGSSYGWPSYKNAGADNLVPMELALKIASKIRAGERFAVYIVIPMWPEGVPSAASVQEILFWQGQTMQMMYEIVAQELKSMNYGNAHPQDYLNFYCLGNREELPNPDSNIDEQQLDKGAAGLAQKHRRFMIYVHAKGMIVDDEYVILGSANINQRSLSGSRDTEIAMGAYQPHFTLAERKRLPHGQIYGYRRSLWAEHLHDIDPIFEEPSSLECVRRVNRIAEDNWAKYTAEEFKPLKGHLLKYPVKVDADGKVEPLPGHEQFPDVGGKVLGAPTSLPDTLTM